jgi:hypothetical protein
MKLELTNGFVTPNFSGYKTHLKTISEFRWSINELKSFNSENIPDFQRKSFNRAKKWLIKNHPEFLI